jgi:steroid delta-isomerase-like uncharacterized protein
MDAIALCRRYFDGWMRRDAGAVLDTLAPDGRYEDPTTPGPLAGEALRGYMQALWAAFPDLGFELGPVHRVGEAQVHAQWTMVGTNTGSLRGLPPTGRAVRVPGIDLIDCSGEGIRRVVGYFDSALLPRQLGLDVIVQPKEIGPFAFGTASVVRPGRPAAAAAIGVTELLVRDEAALSEVRDLTRRIVAEELPQPGFLQFTGAVVGRRATTLSMWDSPTSLHAAMAQGVHREAVRRFQELADAGVTSVWARAPGGVYLQRCAGCGRMNRRTERVGPCAGCGAELASPL